MRSLRMRLILSHILPLLVVVPVIGIMLIYLLESQVFLANALADMTRQAVLVADFASDNSTIWVDTSSAQAFVMRFSSMLAGRIMLLDPQGRVLVSSDPKDKNMIGQFLSVPSQENSSSAKPDVQVNYDSSQGAQIADIYVPVVNAYSRLIGYVRVANPLNVVYARLGQVRQVTFGVLGGGLLLGVGLGWVFARNLEKPISSVTQAVYKLADGKQSEPLEEKGPEEIRLLVRAINTLNQRLQSFEQSRRQLLANLVHELGNPLGALRSAIQALLGGAEEEPVLRQELLEGMDGEVGRLQHLLEDLARLHEQVLGSLEMNFQQVSISDWLPRVLGPWREAALEKRLHWNYQCQDTLPVIPMDPDRMAQALGNLLSNAIRYTPNEGRISVEVGAEDGHVFMRVEDTGPGIASDEQEKIFTPFYRGRSVRRFEQGMGLGLTIARDLVNAHGGKLTLESLPSKGARFTILIPKIKA
jgi:two-component system, OmpR family, sensor histidine kinase BaeS